MQRAFKVINSKPAELIFKIAILLCIFFIGIGFILLKMSFYDLLKYILFHLFYILLPGYLIVCIFNFKQDKTEIFAYSFAFGVSITIAAYFLCYIFNIREFLYFIGPSLSVFGLIHFLKDYTKKSKKEFKEEIDIKFLFTIAMLLLISFLSITLANLSPEIAGTTWFSQDTTFIISIISALKRSFPPETSQFAGLQLNYHYFAFIYRAVISSVTNISSADIFNIFSPIGMIPFIVSSAYIFAKTIFKNNEDKAMIFLWIFFFTACASLIGNAGLFLNITLVNLFTDPNGIDLAIPLMLLIVNLIILMYNNQLKSSFSNLLIINILIIVCSGSKGAMAILLPAVLIFMLFILIILKRNYQSTLKIAVSSIISFAIIYFIFLAKGSGGIIWIEPGYTVNQTLFGTLIKNLLNFFPIYDVKIWTSVLQILFIPMHFFAYLPFASIPFILWFMSKLKVFRQITETQLLIGGLALGGILLTYIFAMQGQSQLYFAMIATPFVEICALIYLFDYFDKFKIFLKYMIIFTLVIAFTSASMVYTITSIRGLTTAKNAMIGSNIQLDPNYGGITKYEYEAMIWLKKHASDKDIIAVDRHYYTEPSVGSIPMPNDNARYFYYSCYSEKQIFLEGWAYLPRTEEMQLKILKRIEIINEIYSSQTINRLKLMQENKIAYILVSRFSNPNLFLKENELDKVFQNRDISIYHLKQEE